MSDNRPLESFRQRLGRDAGTFGQAAVAAAELRPAEPRQAEEYQAFGQEHPELRGEVIEIRYGDGDWCQLERRFLVRVEGAGDSCLALICTNYAVMITGQGLSELRRRLAARKLDFVQEYDPKRWPVSLNGVPKVEKVELLQADGPLADSIQQHRSASM